MRKWVIGAILVGLVVLGGVGQEPQQGGILRIASIGEPPTLDLMVVTSDLASSIGQHIFETLFTFDKNYAPIPLLVDTYERSEDGTEVVFHLRQGVLFHNGKELTSEDVVASLERWKNYGVRAPIFFKNVTGLAAVDRYTFRIVFSEPFGPMESLLAFNNGGPCILPKEVAETAGPEPISPDQYIGTGPYKFAEWVPGRYIRLVKFEDYQPVTAEPSGYGGRRTAYVDELRFIPVPEAGTRVAGIQADDYDYAMDIPADLYDAMVADPNINTFLLTPPIFPLLFMNTKEGIMTNQKLRQAILAALDMDPILQAAYGPLSEANGSIYPKGTAWYTEAGVEAYDQANVARAQELAREAGYNGEPIRFMASTSYITHYNMALVITDQLKQAGFNIDLQIYDWATLVARRADPGLWDMFLTHHGPVPDPSLLTPLSPTYPGWWDTPEKNALVDAFNRATDFGERYTIWEQIQALWYEYVPVIKLGDAFTLDISSTQVKGLDDPHHPALLWPYFWNVWLGS